MFSTVEEILRFVEDEKIEMIDFKVVGTTQLYLLVGLTSKPSSPETCGVIRE